MKNIKYILFFVLLCFNIKAQNDFSFTEKWKYFRIKKAITVTIIEHVPANPSCGVLLTASETIAKTQKGDTIRIFDSCNDRNYQAGKIVKINPQEKRICENSKKICWWLASPVIKNLVTGKFESKVTKYNLSVIKSTWGTIVE